MHGDDDQIVPYADAGPLSAKLLKNGTLKTYKGFPHGMPTTEAASISPSLHRRASGALSRVVVLGCPACKKRLHIQWDFICHLTDDVLPSLLDRLSSVGSHQSI